MRFAVKYSRLRVDYTMLNYCIVYIISIFESQSRKTHNSLFAVQNHPKTYEEVLWELTDAQ